MTAKGVEESFAELLGRAPSEMERAQLHRVRDVLSLQNNDALWLVVMAHMAYEDRLRDFPKAIEAGVEEALRRVQGAVAGAVDVEARRQTSGSVGSASAFNAAQSAALPPSASIGKGLSLEWLIAVSGLVVGGLVGFGGLCMAIGFGFARSGLPSWVQPGGEASPAFRIASAVIGAPAGWMVFLLGLPSALLAIRRGVRMGRDEGRPWGWGVVAIAAAGVVGCLILLARVL